MNLPTWKNHPALKNMDPKKIFLLTKVSEKIQGKNSQEMMPVLFAAMTSAKNQKITFSSEEFDLLFEILKEGCSPKETAQMNQTMDFIKNVLAKNGS